MADCYGRSTWCLGLGVEQEITQLITLNDEDCLRFLVDVRSEFLKDMQVWRAVVVVGVYDVVSLGIVIRYAWVLVPLTCAVQGFRLVFHFARNPYFVNSEITKEFYIQNFIRGEKVLLKTDG